jgi:hypothetical protein
LLHNFVGASNGLFHHGDGRQPFQNGPSMWPSDMHLPYAPAAWWVLSDSTGNNGPFLLSSFLKMSRAAGRHICRLFISPSDHFRVHLFRPCFVRSSELPVVFETCVSYQAHPTTRRDSCGHRTAYTCHNCTDPSSIFIFFSKLIWFCKWIWIHRGILFRKRSWRLLHEMLFHAEFENSIENTLLMQLIKLARSHIRVIQLPQLHFSTITASFLGWNGRVTRAGLIVKKINK